MVAPELDGARAQVLAALQRAMRGSMVKRARLLGVKGEALAAATDANLEASTAPTQRAIERYTGVLYGALDHGSLSATGRRRVDDQVRIFSGLWGLVGPADPIPDYKLKMGSSLMKLGKLSTWWRAGVTAALAPEIVGRTVWDLLPNEHEAAWSPAPSATIVTVRFADEVDGRLTTVSHWNKLLKGALVRHLVTTQLADVDGLVEFTHPLGYTFVPQLTERDAARVRVTFVKPAS